MGGGGGETLCKGRAYLGPEETDPGAACLDFCCCVHAHLQKVKRGTRRWSRGSRPSADATFGSKEKKGKARSQGGAGG